RHWSSYVCSTVLQVGDHEGVAQALAQRGNQRLDIVAGVLRLADVVHDHFELCAPREQAVHARREDALETTVAIHQAALGIADHDPSGPEHHGLSPCEWLW